MADVRAVNFLRLKIPASVLLNVRGTHGFKSPFELSILELSVHRTFAKQAGLWWSENLDSSAIIKFIKIKFSHIVTSSFAVVFKVVLVITFIWPSRVALILPQFTEHLFLARMFPER